MPLLYGAGRQAACLPAMGEHCRGGTVLPTQSANAWMHERGINCPCVALSLWGSLTQAFLEDGDEEEEEEGDSDGRW